MDSHSIQCEKRFTNDSVQKDSWTDIYRKEILPLGEQVLARRPGASVNQLLQPWVTGLWLGRDILSDEHFDWHSWRDEKPSTTPSPRTNKMGASNVERNALPTVVTTSESSRPPSFPETSI